MKIILTTIASLATIALAGVDLPDLDAALNSGPATTEISTPEFAMEAPTSTTELQGVPKVEIKPRRDHMGIVETVKNNQPRLTPTWKHWVITKDNTIPKIYDLTLTINPAGDVIRVNVKGPSNPEFIADITKIIQTWTFERISADSNQTVTLRNLDFTFRNQLVLE